MIDIKESLKIFCILLENDGIIIDPETLRGLKYNQKKYEIKG